MTMKKTLSTPVAALAILTLSATPALAGDMKAEKESSVKQQTQVQTVRTIDGDNRVGELTIFDAGENEQSSAVLGAVATQNTDAYVVRDQAGQLYINHLIKVEDLPDPRLTVRTVDEYEYEYQGRIFTNRVVNETQ